MIPVLLYSHPEEPITKAILSSSRSLKNRLITVPLKRLLDDITIIDEFDHENVHLNWTFSCGMKITNSTDFYLINRVISIPEELFLDFCEEDRQYSITEFRAYIAFAIEAFPNTFSKPEAFGLSGNRFSLPRQWEIIKKSKTRLKTPNYYLGNMQFCPLKEGLIYSNPFDFYYWKPSHKLVTTNDNSFVFQKPSGRPIVVSIIGDVVKLFFYDSKDAISSNIQLLLNQHAQQLAKLFNYSIAEILFFVEEKSLSISFGMITNIPFASKDKIWFSDNVNSYFEKLLEQNGTT